MPLNDEMKGNLHNIINKFAQNALRTICLAYKEIQPNEYGVRHDKGAVIKDIEIGGFTMISIFGIMDIIRPEVP